MVLTILLLSGCYYDIEEDLYPTIECETENMSYQNDILPIIESNCFNCHDAISNFGNVTLEGYASLKKYVDNSSLLGTIRHDGGFSPMPKNAPMLLECEVEKIEKWVENGALNN